MTRYLNVVADPLLVKNSSGGVVAAGDVGYIDEAGEYVETTTEHDNVAWCVVVLGGADTADIYVTNRGRATVTLDQNCSAGDYLYTSTTAGQATSETYVRPEVFGVALTANAAGAGGTCEALLLCNRKYVNDPEATGYFIVATSTYDFVATINGAPVGAAVVYNAPSSGAENTIEPYNSVDYNYKLVLANTTRGDAALIQDVDTGTNTITLTAAAPGAWQNGDSITARSQTAGGVYGGQSRYYEMDVEDTVDALAVSIALEVEMSDSGGANAWAGSGDVKATPDIFLVRTQVANVYNGVTMIAPLVNRRFTTVLYATGAGTANSIWRQQGYYVAAP